MEAERRREAIWQDLQRASKPVSASKLAERMGVSRQIIVGDIALLRAQGCSIIATARGYTLTPESVQGRFIGKIVCQHMFDQTEEELRTIVSRGGEVLDVIVEHDVYGEITGQLNIGSEQDIEAFMHKVRCNEARLLSELTGGVHIHTVSCRDVARFESIKSALEARSLLYRES